jgi:hypothetical protein
VFNIGLTGPYGSGKSFVVRTSIKEDNNKHHSLELVRCIVSHHFNRAPHEAIDMMEACKDTEDLRTLYIDMLIEWKMYDEALELMDISDVDEVFLGDYSEKTFEVLEMIGNREKTIEVCKYRFRTVDRKQPYYDKLRVPPSGEIQSVASDKISHSRVC